VNTHRTPSVALPLLVLANLAVLLFTLAQLINTGVPTTIIEWALIPISLTDSLTTGSLLEIGSELLTLLTCTFVHGSFDHFFSNMLMLMVFGTLVENRLGAVRFMGIYIASGLLASLGHYLVDVQSPYPLIGASGAVSGIMAAFVVSVFATGKRPTLLPILGTVFIAQWLFDQFVSVMASPIRLKGTAVAYDAHLAGFFTGLAITVIVVILMKRRTETEPDEEDDSIDWDRLLNQSKTQTPNPGSEAATGSEPNPGLDGNGSAGQDREALGQGSNTTAKESGLNGNGSAAHDRELLGNGSNVIVEERDPADHGSLAQDRDPLLNGSNAIVQEPDPDVADERIVELKLPTTSSTDTIADIHPTISALEVNGQSPVSEAAPPVTRVRQIGYQPDKNDNLTD